MTQDYYEILQVHPKADSAAITAAYTRLRDLYDPARLDGAAEELVVLARRKRDEIERAYAVLGDSIRRATYDAEQAAIAPSEPVDQKAVRTGAGAGTGTTAEGAPLDYRPLPPARRAERPRDFDTQPVLATAGRQAPAAGRGRAPLWLAGLLVLVLGISLVLSGASGPAPAAAPSPVADQEAVLNQFEAQLPQQKQVAEQNPNDPQAWITYGNLLYDSAQVVRELSPDSALYQQRLSRWLEATEAYTRALALQPDNPAVRADLGTSACFYGAGTGDQTFVRSGTTEVRRAVQVAPDNTRALLSLGYCLVSSQPPRTQEALQSWRRVVQIAPPDDSLAAQAQQLIARYSQ